MSDIISGTVLAVMAFLIIVKGGQVFSGGKTGIQLIANAVSTVYVGAVKALTGQS